MSFVFYLDFVLKSSLSTMSIFFVYYEYRYSKFLFVCLSWTILFPSFHFQSVCVFSLTNLWLPWDSYVDL